VGSIKIKDFFNGRFFEIPKYQRGYSWDLQNIRELFEDILESIESKANHYIGTIVLSKDGDDEDKYFIVDGQQRVTTVTMIILVLIGHLGKSDSDYYRRFYLFDDNRYRLVPLNRDRAYFVDLLEGNSPVPQNKSQRALLAALREIRLKVDTLPEKAAFLKAIEKLEVLEFTENTEGDAIRIFQTVNDRGKLLSNMEKAKSLLIYFSNRYLDKRLDDEINDAFSDIFEVYDDIKQLGEELNITLIKGRDFDEDNIMRYHYVSYSKSNYDPSAGYVLSQLKADLSELRTTAKGDYSAMENYISEYIEDVKNFYAAFKSLLEKASVNCKYYKVFSTLSLSARLYPLAVRLEMAKRLDEPVLLENGGSVTLLEMLELVDVRVYKTRGTDPKADIAEFSCDAVDKTNKAILDWLLWFNAKWMPREQFKAALASNIYGNSALSYIFIRHCEDESGNEFSIDELKKITSLEPNIEHVLAQTPDFDPVALGFVDEEDYINHEHRLGNLTVLERALNSAVKNKVPIDKTDTYDRSYFLETKSLGSIIQGKKRYTKAELLQRTAVLSAYCEKTWWCDVTNLESEAAFGSKAMEE